MRKKSTRKRPLESSMTAILLDAAGKMHHGILFDRHWFWPILFFSARHQLNTWTLAPQKTRGMA